MIRVRVEDHGSNAALGRSGRRLSSALGEVTREFARRGAEGARARGASLGGVHAHAAPGITATGKSNRIRFNLRRHPELMGAEFGGGHRPTTRQFPPWRGAGRDAGYMLFPALRSLEDELDRMVDTVLERSLR